MGTSSDGYELNHECASTSDLITSTRTSTHSSMACVCVFSWWVIFVFHKLYLHQITKNGLYFVL